MKKLLIVLMMSSIAYAAFGEGQGEPADDTDLAYLNPTGYPIVNEEIEISVVAAQTATQPHFNESLQIPILEEITGIKVDWQLTPWTSRGDKKNILMASGDYPDVLFRMGLNANDITTYGVEQQSFVVLDDLIDEYAPNLTAITDEYPFILDHMRATDGHIYALPRIKDPAFASMMSGARLYFRVDWLEQLGLSEPTTTDELYEVLRAFKDSDMNGNGEADEYPFYGMALGNLLFNMSGSWGLMNRGQTNQNVDVDEDTGELRFIKADPMYREMLKYMNRLYTEELINYDIFTWSWGRVQSNMLLGLVGAYGGWATTALTDEIDFTGFNAMEGPFGDRLYSAMGSPAEPRFMAVITDTNPYPEATMRWLDYMYSDEAAVLLNMGVEDVSYTVDGGNYVFTDLINDNPEGLSQSEARNLYFPSVSGWLGVVKQELFFGSESSTTALAATAKTAPYHVDVWPELTFTTAENEVMRGIGIDLITYADESRAQFIMGELDLYDDAVWEDYLATLTRIGLDEYMSVCRSAVARLGLK